MGAADYAALFRVWPMRGKAPLAAGFGKDYPTATYPVERFDPALPVGILCGPLQPGIADGYHILGLDLDKAMTRAVLEEHIGALPPTLTSKGERHLYYFIPADHPLYQRNKAIVIDGGALDIRPCAGGYLVERGDWDGGYDPVRIAELPAHALTALASILGEKRKRDGVPPTAAPVQIADSDRDIAQILSEIWQHDTTGDRAFGGLGGWLARRGVSRDRAEALTGLLAELTHSTHPDPMGRVAQAYDGACPLGRPALQAALCERADATAVEITLNQIENQLLDSVAGYAPPAEPPKRKAMLNLVSAAELAARSVKVDWLVEGLDFAPGRPLIAGGKAGAGKTLGFQDMALRVAGAGGNVWGEFPISRQGSVLHIDVDQGPLATQLRYLKLARGMGVDFAKMAIDCAFFDFAISTKQGINPAAVAALRGACTGRALCIIDSLRGIAPGLDEQSSEFGEVLQTLTELASDTGCAFVVVAHSGHEAARARGTSAIQDRGGPVYQLTREEGQQRVTWRQNKSSEYGSELRKFDTVMTKAADGLNEKIVLSVERPAEQQREESHSRVVERIRQEIIAVLRKEGPASVNTLLGYVQGKSDLIRETAKAMATEGILTYGGGVYRLV